MVDIPWLLRTWRGQVCEGVSQRAAAQRALVSHGHLSEWESGGRRPPLDSIRLLDAGYDAGGVLLAIALAVGTAGVGGLPPRQRWLFNFQETGAPVWAWVRSPDPRQALTATITWGPITLEVVESCQAGGFFVAAPFAVKNPAVEVRLDKPGWVDFGVGTIPPELGLPVIDGMRSLALLKDREYLHVAVESLAAMALRIRGKAPRRAVQLARAAARIRVEAAQRVRRSPIEVWGDYEDLTARSAPSPEPEQGQFSGPRYARLRLARTMSQRQAAELVTNLQPERPVSADQLGRFERGRLVRVKWLRARLDCVYRAGGFTCTETADARRHGPPTAEASYTVGFPPFWVGPVWIAFVGPAPGCVGRVTLHWWPWRKALRVDSGATVTVRRSTVDSPPLVVVVPRAWRVRAGVGMHEEAIDVNAGWAPDRPRGESEVWRQYGPVHERLARATLRMLRGDSG